MSTQIRSLDQLLEDALVALFGRWHTLPRRSTLAPLSHLRADLAARLETLAAPPGPVNLPAYEQAMIDFARAACQLPEVADAGEAPLRDLAHAETAATRPSWDNWAFSPTDATSGRLAALTLMLRAPDPTQFLIKRMRYAPEQTTQAWTAVWNKLSPVLGRLPSDVHSQIEAINIQLAADVAGASATIDKQAAFAAALVAMEEISAVVRIAWPIFLHWKYLGDVPRMLAADATIKAVQAIPTPDLWQAFDVVAAEPAPTTVDVDFFANIKVPSRASLGKTIWLLVQLTIKAPEGSTTTAKVPVQFTRPAPDTVPPPEAVEVRLVAPGFTEETAVWSRTIMVYPDRDSQPAVFLLTAQNLGLQHLTIDLYQHGRMLTSFGVDTTVVEGAVNDAPRAQVQQIDMADFGGTPPAPADLELRVVKASEQNKLGFMLNSSRPDIPFRNRAVGQKNLTEKDPQSFFTKRLERLSQLAADGDAEAGPERVLNEIAAMGEGLFELLIPTELQQIYWDEIKPLREQGIIKTLLITSDEPWIPWELVKPYQWDDVTDTEKSDGFLAETFTLSRWLAGRGPGARLAVEQVTLVMPDLDLAFVQEEKKFFDGLAVRRNIQVTGPLQRRLEVTDLFRSAGYQVLHFATHGSFNSADADQSQLSLQDGDLAPGDLVGSDLSGIRRARPLVFLNACHSGQVALGLTGLGGWADKLFREAKVSAFVGTLWEVNDELAAEFAKHFYDGLAGDLPLGAALKAARIHVQQLAPSNPTWLAYALYGDPNAQVAIGHATN